MVKATTDKLRIEQSYVVNAIASLALVVDAGVCEFDQVVGIANSGLHISRPLASLLRKPHSFIRISHYDGQVERETPIVEHDLIQPTRNLVVDDMIDGGSTIRTFDKYYGLEGNFICVVWWNPQSGFEPHFYYDLKPDKWLVLPWDKE